MKLQQEMVMVLTEIVGRGVGARVTTDMILRIGNLLAAYAESGKAAARFGLSPEVAEKVGLLIVGGKYVEAIKTVRVARGLSLREAKDIVDAMRGLMSAPR